MTSSCVRQLVRNILLLIHVIYWTCGLFLIYLSMWSMVYKSRGTFLSIISAAGEDLLRLVCFCLAVSGCLVLSVGITGVLGTVQVTRGWMTLFIALVLILLTVESVCCVMILLYQPRLLLSMKKVVQARLIHDYGRSGEESFSVGVDWVQYRLSCCGVVSPADYQNSQVEAWRHNTNISRHSLQVPLTCCSLLNKGSSGAWLEPQPENWSACQSISVQLRGDNRFTRGCFDEVTRWLISQNILITVVTASAMSLQISSIILTLFMCRYTNKTIYGHFV